MDFDKLDSILKQKGISRRKLALALGIPESTMSSAFMRRSGLSPDVALRIAQYLGVDYYVLQGWKIGTDENGFQYYSKGWMQLDAPFEKEGEIINDRETVTVLNQKIEQMEKQNDRLDSMVDRHTKLTTAFNKLNSVGQQKAVDYVVDLTGNPKYTKPEQEE